MGWLAKRRAARRRREELEALARTVVTLHLGGSLIIGPSTFDELYFMARYSGKRRLEIDLIETEINPSMKLVIHAR